jgi:hypothetical protein
MADGVDSGGLPDALLADLKDEIIKILEYAAPDEVAALRLFGDDLMEGIARSAHSPGKRSNAPTFEFSPALDISLVTMHLIAGTLALIEAIQRTKVRREEKASESNIRKEWAQFLLAQGMSEGLANTIPIKFSLELSIFLAKYKIGKSET